MKAKKLLCVVFSFITALAVTGEIFAAKGRAAALADPVFETLSYPQEALTPFSEEILSRAVGADGYEANRGYDETCLYISPYWSCTAEGRDIPVYATLTYDGTLDGVLQSYAAVFVSDFGDGLTFCLTCSETVLDAEVLPSKLETGCSVRGNNVTLTVTGYGCYCVLVNGRSQKNALTLFGREYVDEEAQIAEYTEMYGADQVQVYEKGYYQKDILETDCKRVIYFCRGSFFSANHLYDLNSEDDYRAIPRQTSFLSLSGSENVTVTGFGTFDFNKLDRKERGPVELSYCKNCTVEGLLILNSPHWTVTLHDCDNLALKEIAVVGYRTNSDAINVCCSKNVKVSDCFARNGDDCYSVKTTAAGLPSEHITFTNCVAWSNKARCYGITGEDNSPINDILFADSAVICHNVTWDLNRVSSLAVQVEYGGAHIKDVVFENIEIHDEIGRPINVMITNSEIKNCVVEGVVFRNITSDGRERSRLAVKQNMNAAEKIRCFLYRILTTLFPFASVREKCSSLLPDGNRVSVTFDNVYINGRKLNQANFGFFFTRSGGEDIRFEN
ncbi:MAG: hypothetical protein IJS90_02090 [Clostridia bacterium]|nr:hypothetical protein [Clostridia bacterium]